MTGKQLSGRCKLQLLNSSEHSLIFVQTLSKDGPCRWILASRHSYRTCLAQYFFAYARLPKGHEFVDSVLAAAREMERQYRLRAQGFSFDTIIARVLQIFDVPEERIRTSGKEPKRVKVRSVAAYWAVRELCMAATEVGRELGLTRSAVSRSVQRGEDIVEELRISLTDDGNA